jgi:pyruvate/2-oxoacid:ferredoxin oxidoreductase beta subunit
MNIRVPSFFGPAFEGAAAFATGLARGYKIIGREDITVAALIGDGGTADIGFQGLSGAAERNENIMWFTYDNEAYMNTGGQRSSATPAHASTTTTPIAKNSRGKSAEKKNVPMILALHRIRRLSRGLDSENHVREGAEGLPILAHLQPMPDGVGYRP